MIVLVTYDVVQDERREAVSAVLGQCGARVQLSVFECEVAGSAKLSELKQAVRAAIDVDEDQVRFYPLPADATRGVEILGNRRLEERADFWIV